MSQSLTIEHNSDREEGGHRKVLNSKKDGWAYFSFIASGMGGEDTKEVSTSSTDTVAPQNMSSHV